MTKLYFTDPIKALWMHKEFGVKFDKEVIIRADLTENNSYENMTPELQKFYVAKESEHIFEPKEGDIGAYFKNNKILFANLLTEIISVWIEIIDRREAYWVSDQVVITMRDGKQFFNPENEGVRE